ncbi:glutamate-1-semialdehyde 2,1-aminomutase [uncultured Draconibacterium sp.]|uniref:glutamate-1-semialdehyde 2,1-aminomutase n=1 Tax=uncultured Draconibacterium sp. TaxID=1573823 RepID=UPI0032619795
MKTEQSKQLFRRAQQSIPGGVNSPVRTFAGVGGTPRFIKSASGSLLLDADGNAYIDYLGSWGPMILGHAWPGVVRAVQQQLAHSSSYGLLTEKEIELAELVVSMVPGIEKVRLVNSGTEACMTAVRLARAATGRQKIIKFNGCYHGHADTFLVKAGSGALTLGNPSSPGVSVNAVQNTLIAEFNQLPTVEEIIANNPGAIAAIIVEPVAGNMGCIPPDDNFLRGLRKLATKNGIVLIFDEVMTGFRLAPGGAQEVFNIRADLVTYGKIIGGGFPVGAIAGPESIMDLLAPAGPVYQAGTLSGNPVATTAGIAILSELKSNHGIYAQLNQKSEILQNGLQQVFNSFDLPHRINRVGSMLSVFFTNRQVHSFADVQEADMDLFARFFQQMLNHGVHLPPSGYEAWFIAATHTEKLLLETIAAAKSSCHSLMKKPVVR